VGGVSGSLVLAMPFSFVLSSGQEKIGVAQFNSRTCVNESIFFSIPFAISDP
jgi:hypothetical protein